MTGTITDHPLVREYLHDLDAAMRVLPAAQAREIREQITGHLDEALPPDADDEEIAAALSRLGPPGPAGPVPAGPCHVDLRDLPAEG